MGSVMFGMMFLPIEAYPMVPNNAIAKKKSVTIVGCRMAKRVNHMFERTYAPAFRIVPSSWVRQPVLPVPT